MKGPLSSVGRVRSVENPTAAQYGADMIMLCNQIRIGSGASIGRMHLMGTGQEDKRNTR